MNPLAMGRISAIWIAGIGLGLVGAALNFYRGYVALIRHQAPTATMGGPVAYPSGELFWGFGWLILGVVVMATSVAMLFRAGPGGMKGFGALMVVYGLAMISLGSGMYAEIGPMSFDLLPWGMPVIGALMAVNGALMILNPLRSA